VNSDSGGGAKSVHVGAGFSVHIQPD
jgi:hypothetical protein